MKISLGITPFFSKTVYILLITGSAIVLAFGTGCTTGIGGWNLFSDYDGIGRYRDGYDPGTSYSSNYSSNYSSGYYSPSSGDYHSGYSSSYSYNQPEYSSDAAPHYGASYYPSPSQFDHSAEITELRNTIRSSIQADQATIHSMRERLSDLEAANNRMRHDIKIVSQRPATDPKLVAAADTVNYLKSRIAGMERQISNQDAVITQLEIDLGRESQSRVQAEEGLRQQMSNLMDSRSRSRQSLQSLQSRIDRVESETRDRRYGYNGYDGPQSSSYSSSSSTGSYQNPSSRTSGSRTYSDYPDYSGPTRSSRGVTELGEGYASDSNRSTRSSGLLGSPDSRPAPSRRPSIVTRPAAQPRTRPTYVTPPSPPTPPYIPPAPVPSPPPPSSSSSSSIGKSSKSTGTSSGYSYNRISDPVSAPERGSQVSPYGSNPEYASSAATMIPPGRYKKYRVRAGDVASQLAISHGVRLSQIMAANPGVDIDHIRVGEVLLIPLAE